MKNFFFSLIAIVGISAFAAAQTHFVSMKLPKNLASLEKQAEIVTRNVTLTTKEGKRIKGQVRLTIPEKGQGLVAAEFTANLLDGTGLTPNFFTDNQTAFANEEGGTRQPFNLSACLQQCMTTFTTPDGKKIPGRGACKFDCWMVAAATVAVKTLTLGIVTEI